MKKIISLIIFISLTIWGIKESKAQYEPPNVYLGYTIEEILADNPTKSFELNESNLKASYNGHNVYHNFDKITKVTYSVFVTSTEEYTEYLDNALKSINAEVIVNDEGWFYVYEKVMYYLWYDKEKNMYIWLIKKYDDSKL